jgi:pimeloyl-ACP methyl ester carboxylesterase
MDLLVDAVLRVCGQLGISRAHFAGHSMGTIVCQHVAVRAPERVRSLALFGALLAPPEAARQGLRTRATKARDEGMFGIADAIVQGALSSSTREQLPVVVAFVRESLLAQDPEGYARTCEALAAAEPAAIDAIDVPTLLVAGDEDAIAPVQVAREMARRIGDAQVESLSRCGHWMTAERAADCQSYLRRFLERSMART